MLTAYAIGDRGPMVLDASSGAVPAETAWVDLYQPTADEEVAAEAFLGVDIPTREESQEIEFSSRFYTEDGAIIMTASVLSGVHLGQPALTPFTFVIAGPRLVTLRYDDLNAFRQFLARAPKPGSGCTSSTAAFLGLIEAFVDRTADVVEHVSQEVDKLSTEIFRRGGRRRGQRLAVIIGHIGIQGDLASKARESLASIERLVQFANTMVANPAPKSGFSGRLKLALRDVRSLEDHVTFVLNKITFLLDATLGLIQTEQSQVVSVLTVASTILLPPMLIGTIYGMNFRAMPELDWMFGYPIALGAMLVSAAVPYLYFKRRGWF